MTKVFIIWRLLNVLKVAVIKPRNIYKNVSATELFCLFLTLEIYNLVLVFLSYMLVSWNLKLYIFYLHNSISPCTVPDPLPYLIFQQQVTWLTMPCFQHLSPKPLMNSILLQSWGAYLFTNESVNRIKRQVTNENNTGLISKIYRNILVRKKYNNTQKNHWAKVKNKQLGKEKIQKADNCVKKYTLRSRIVKNFPPPVKLLIGPKWICTWIFFTVSVSFGVMEN